MLLRAQAIGKEPCIRFVIRKLEDDTFWNGVDFTDDIETCMKYWRPSDACFDMQDILKEHYRKLPKRKFVVPIEIEVFGNVSKRDISEYLHRASVLSIRTEEFGNGPIDESYVAPVIHWGYIRPIEGSAKEQIDDLAAEWGIELNSESKKEDEEKS